MKAKPSKKHFVRKPINDYWGDYVKEGMKGTFENYLKKNRK